MPEQILLPPKETPRRKFWKLWKIIGLSIYIFVLLFHRIVPGPIVFFGHLYGLIVVAGMLFFIARHLKDRFFWRVRNRLIGSFVFTGFIPLLILIGIIFASGYLLFGQLAWQYFDNALKENKLLISDINDELNKRISPIDPLSLQKKAPLLFAKYSGQFPQLAARLVHKKTNGQLEEVSTYDPFHILPKLSPHPGDKWLAGASKYEGLLGEDDALFITSFQAASETDNFYIETTAPIDLAFAKRLFREKYIYAIFYGSDSIQVSNGSNNIAVTTPSREKLITQKKKDILERRDVVEKARQQDSRSKVYWLTTLRGKRYSSGKEDFVGAALFSIPKIIITDSLNPDNFQNMLTFGILFILGVVLLIAVIFCMIIGAIISRQIAGSVHDIHQGILALQKGNLQHRMPIRRNDQLGLLAHSFNQMSESISRLLVEVVEKKRLERDLEIAREVQSALFPKILPHPPGMSIFGGCKPAQTISGDYYDFIIEDETHLYIIVADISGKGIPAALLMANLQAAIHNHLHSLKNDDPDIVGKSLADAMMQLNHQVYLNSPAERYATLFISRYDTDTHRLWYCNAGHPSPLILDDQGAHWLDSTGTVIGLFPDAEYQTKCIDLIPGALLAIFSDGATEAVNSKNEEFGDQKILKALQEQSSHSPEEIWSFIISEIKEWQGDLPQNDDITLIVSKIA
jgi:serine phosphatase RsbU (regulator of sigma subunit)